MSTPRPVVLPPTDWRTELAVDAFGRTGGVHPESRRRYFGRSLASLPVTPLLLLGMLLGPQGLFILTPAALAAVDPALPVALATLGALVGLMPGLQGPFRRAIGGAATNMFVTATIVATGFAVGALINADASRTFVWLLPAVLGICAASSLIVPVPRSLDPLSGPTTTIESEALVTVIAGGLLLAFVRQTTVFGAIAWLLQASAVVTMLGLAGFLLLRKSVADAERRVFAVATLLLVGGAADSLSFSALCGGLCAGLLWKACGGLSRDSLHRDMSYALPPLIAIVLVVAGARAELSTVSIGLAAAYALLRTVARVVTGWLTKRRSPRAAGASPFSLLAPGVFGIAFALNAVRALGSDVSIALSVVVIGTVFAEVTALLVTPRETAE